MATICVDVGTSVIKTVASDDHGTDIGLARQETDVLRPAPGFSEQDMYSVWDAAAFTVRTVVHQLTDRTWLISLTAQEAGRGLVDADGHRTVPVILRNDARAETIVDRWREAGILKEAFHRNGSQTFAGLPNGIFTWLKQHDPDRLERSHKSLCCNGWIFYNLTRRMAIDESDAAVPFFDIRERRYSPELLQLYGLEWAERLLPGVLAHDQRVGELHSTAATELGLPAGLPVVMSPYDVASTAIGVGTVSDGQACSILGTTLCTEIVVNHINLEREPSGLTLPFGPPGLYLRAFRLGDQEVGAKGAFIVGLVAVGQAVDFPSAAKDYVQIRDEFEPDKERHARYDELFEQFLAIRERTLPSWKLMADNRK